MFFVYWDGPRYEVIDLDDDGTKLDDPRLAWRTKQEEQPTADEDQSKK